MKQTWFERFRFWLCRKIGHICLRGGWIHDGYYHRECSWCGRIVSEPIREKVKP